MKIDVAEHFEYLRNAPIVEAAVEVRARAEVAWDEKLISDQLKARLPDYPQVVSQNAVTHEFNIAPGQPPQALQLDLGWRGLVCRSPDEKQIAQFNRDSFVFSRLQPYLGWDKLSAETMRLWRIHADISHAVEAQRLGLRFINRIGLDSFPTGLNLGAYIRPPPQPPRDLDLPINGFFHQDTLGGTGYPYLINIIRTLQPAQTSPNHAFGLIIDIDIVTVQPFHADEEALKTRLSEMRWLKNKIFFGSVTQEALKKFQ